MTTERDPRTRTVLSWLREDLHENAERVLLRALDEVDATPQRRPFWSAWRVSRMNSPVRYAIAAAAVLVVAFVGYQFLPASNRVPGDASPTPSPSATVAPALPLTDSLAAGTYRPYLDIDLTFEAPGGWSTCCATPASIVYRGEPLGAAIFFEDFTDLVVPEDPCTWDSGASSQPRGAQAIAGALAAQEGSMTPVPEELAVAGRPGFHVRLMVPDDLDVQEQDDGDYTFLTCEGGQYTFWTSPSLGSRYSQGPGQIENVYIVDAGDRIVAFDLSTYERTAAADAAGLEAMLESIKIP